MTNIISTQINPSLTKLTPYEPGKPIEELAREYGFSPNEIIKLASNENPLGPSPFAVEAIAKNLHKIHLYPDGNGYALKKALAASLDIDTENIVLGNGSNEIIELLFHLFASSPTEEVLFSKYAFAVYKLMAELFGASFKEVDDRSFSHDLQSILHSIGPKTKLIFIANPNNPTGTRIPNEQLYEFLDAVPERVVVAIDEAYIDFVPDPPQTLSFIKKRENIVILRTFSKMHGLAGLRIGYGIAPKSIANYLQRARQPFNTNFLAQVAATASLEDKQHILQTLKITEEGKKRLEDGFNRLGLRFIPSSANFILVHVGDGDYVFKSFLKKGIIIRPMKSYGLAEWVRITVGTPEQLSKLLEAFPSILLPLRTLDKK
ncbi:aspartate aminotransferase [Methylacidiphilum kamchatkense Kam1]|uniref:Histidinol-phosphate aminotransferase n=1 Tax=Methylacidiphilum kamchatkense Kam1 TaxID=1202785 RepID=A0A0C1RLN5_9BACT|nr:histidinol-phosphate transaminase [Methylacidiphilum kamchatkense]KIE58967.1 aspartate aminotransferase [Methylacidiphilum kamchatkense Kam1]QDQ43151.1 histidinol-phosphate aminotransferase [Methylacidiphilum kamchatkense Kam1]